MDGAKLIVAILGGLKAGAIYVPMDSKLPKDRLLFILTNVRPRFIVSSKALYANIAAVLDVQCDLLDEDSLSDYYLLACYYYALLYRYTGQEDILVGAPIANRAHPELEPVIGIFVNTLILRARLQDTQTFSELLHSVQAMSLAAFEYQALPFPKLVDELNVERVSGYPPLYQVVFEFQNASLIESENPSAEGETMHEGNYFPFVHSNTSKVDLNLTVTQVTGSAGY